MNIPSILTVAGSALSLAAVAPAATALASPATTPPAAPAPAAAAAAPASASAAQCADGFWVGPDGISVQGRPDHLDAGDRGAVYVWHDAAGWHVRTTDISRDAHHYTGTITASPGTRFTDFAPFRNEKGDSVWLSGDSVLHYSLTTYNGVDGFNFRVAACGNDRAREALRFSMDFNGHEDDPARIMLGDAKRHPDAATFSVRRVDRLAQ